MDKHFRDDKPVWKHDCDKCRFLGNTIGRGQLVDCYVCNEEFNKARKRAPTLIARYSSRVGDYSSSSVNMVHPGGHAELWAAKGLFLLTLAEEAWWDQEDAA